MKIVNAFQKILCAGFVALPIVGINQSHACGPDTDCVIGNDRHYRIRMPEGHDGKTEVGAILIWAWHLLHPKLHMKTGQFPAHLLSMFLLSLNTLKQL